MKIECIKDNLKTALERVSRMVGKNLSLPVLSGTLLLGDEKKNSLSLRSTNLDLGIEVSLPSKIEGIGEVVIPPGVLMGILSGIYDKKITLEFTDGNLLVTSNSISSVIKGLPNEDFPTLPVISSAKSFEIPAEKFFDGVQSVWYAAGTSDIKPEIASVYMYGEGEYITFVATDSFRLAEKKIFMPGAMDGMRLLIPHKNIIEITRVFEGISGNIVVLFNKNQVSFASEGIYVTSRVIDGIFPDYEQILPKSFTSEATVLKQELLNILKVATVFSDKLNRIDLSISPKKKMFEIRSQNAAVGENTSHLDASLLGEEIALGFNHKYILDCFQSIKQESVTLRFAGQGKPVVIGGVGDKSFLYLIMPLMA